MTFNFVLMLIVLGVLILDYLLSQRSRGILLGDYNTSETALKWGLLLYIIYVFGMKK
jgi:hypothetical protein